MRKNTGKLTYAALISGLSVALLWISAFFPTMSLTIVAIAGICIISVLIECGYKYAGICLGATGILSLIMIPDKSNAVLYLLIFGSYPLLKSVFERIKNVGLGYFCKVFYCVCVLCVLYFLFTGIVLEFVPMEHYVLPILLVGGLLFFLLYDFALSRLIVFYFQRIHTKLGRFVK